MAKGQRPEHGPKKKQTKSCASIKLNKQIAVPQQHFRKRLFSTRNNSKLHTVLQFFTKNPYKQPTARLNTKFFPKKILKNILCGNILAQYGFFEKIARTVWVLYFFEKQKFKKDEVASGFKAASRRRFRFNFELCEGWEPLQCQLKHNFDC